MAVNPGNRINPQESQWAAGVAAAAMIARDDELLKDLELSQVIESLNNTNPNYERQRFLETLKLYEGQNN